ncbi:MAG: chemotaxis protein CheD [Granulosicoccus sp.]|nr:chemotaxis protein CheD [Granulosicoccus sp.]
MSKEIHVNIGEIKIAKAPDMLKSLLGSCIGIGFVWRKKKIFGLAHCLLPIGSDANNSASARYISEAVPQLIKQMGIEKRDRKYIEVHIAGGASTLNQNYNIGEKNIVAVREVLNEYGFTVKYEDLGGELSRQIVVDCNKYDVDIKVLNRAVGS